MPPSCCVPFFSPHEGINFGNKLLFKTSKNESRYSHKSALTPQPGAFTNVMPRNHRLFSALLKLQQNKNGTENTYGVGFGFPSSVSKTD